MTLDALARRLPHAWSLASSSRWTPGIPAAGQCSVTAILAQECCGGDILKTQVGGAWHFYNRIDGHRQDLTAGQFLAPITYDDLASNREEAMADTLPGQCAALAARLGLTRVA